MIFDEFSFSCISYLSTNLKLIEWNLQPQVFLANHGEKHSSKKNSVTVTWVMSTQAVNFQATKYILVQDKTETKWLKHTKIKRDLC